jgi:transcriptional regulator with XRE-family HTH domain
MDTVGRRIRRLRIERGLRQRDLTGPGVCAAHVCAVETGKRQATLETLRVIAARLGVIPELLEKGRSETVTDELAAAALARSDGALWIVLTRAGSTFTWQEAGERLQLERIGENITEGLLALTALGDELARLEAAETDARERRQEIVRERRAPD